MEDYRERLEGTMKGGADAEHIRKADSIERALRLAAIRAEREEIYRLGREVDLLEARYVAARSSAVVPSSSGESSRNSHQLQQ